MLGDGRHAQVVDAILHAGGTTEFLAVAPREEDVGSAGAAVASETGADAGAAAGGPPQLESGPLECRPLPLPYAFPD